MRSDGRRSASDGRSARGAAPSTPCSSGAQANGWREPRQSWSERFAAAEGLGRRGPGDRRPRCWRRRAPGSARLFAGERVAARRARVRAEVPLLLGSPAPCCAARSTCWSSATGTPPLIVDYKTDRLDGAEPGRARRPLRDPARRSTRSRSPRRGASTRSRSPTSSSSGPRSRCSPSSTRGGDRRRALARPSPGSRQ